jgi:hypothetical protein
MAHSSESVGIKCPVESTPNNNFAEPSSLDLGLHDTPLSFRAYFIRIYGPEIDPIVRMLLVETSVAQPIYEGFGSLPECERWIVQLTGWIIPKDVMSDLRKRIEQKRMATINGVQVSRREIESIGLQTLGQSFGQAAPASE